MADDVTEVTETTTPDTTNSTETTETVDTAVETVADTSTDTAETTDTTGDEDTTVLGDPDATADDKAEAEDGDDKEAVTGAPEKYELTLKDADGNDLALDEELVAEADPILREMNLSNEDANRLMPLAAKLQTQAQQSTLQQVIDAGAAQRKEWLDAYKADPDIGGANQKESARLAAVGLDAMGFGKDHPFRTLLNETGFGNHPDAIRTFKTLGELAGEDGTFARSSSAAETDVGGWENRYKSD